MSKSLVIVESPAKAKTIEKYLGKGFEVLASVGHIMDLPKKEIGVELENRTFEPTLVVSPGKEKVVAQLKKAAAKADEIFLAPDPDREGEAIAYHLALQLGTSAKERKKIRRVTFNEITKKAVQEAFNHARDLDQNLVDSQQTRRVLDRLVGYQISPLLWDKVRRGLSAGRVQTVALRLIVEREREIGAFGAGGVLANRCDVAVHAGGKQCRQKFLTARFVGIDGEPARVANGKDKDGKEQFIPTLCRTKSRQWTRLTAATKGSIGTGLGSFEKKQRKKIRCRRSSQAVCSSRLRRGWASTCGARWAWRSGSMKASIWAPKDTVGLITYMRTDSPRVAPEAIAGAREWVGKELGAKYLPESPNYYKGKKDAQDAHEAIRPTDASRTPESIARYLTEEQLKLYRLIWQRFVASQMVPAIYDVTTTKIDAASDRRLITSASPDRCSIRRFPARLRSR